MSNCPTVALDVDDVTLQLVPVWLKKLEERTSCGPLDISGHRSWRLEDFLPERYHEELYSILDDQNLYDMVEPVPGAFDGVAALREMGLRVVFVTSAANGHAGAKLRWLVDHGFLPSVKFAKDYVECYDKTLINADILVDDRPKSCLDFNEIHGPRSSILFMPRYLDTEYREGLQFVQNWDGLVKGLPVALRFLHR